MNSGNGPSLKIFQDTAMDIYRNVAPVIRRYTSRIHGTAAEKMASMQQAENLKWQQDMFLRLMNMVGLYHEGLLNEEDVARFRQKIIDRVVVCFDGGEWPGVTRDKLIFLQELLFAGCISEDEYHSAKKPVLYRMADQGAEVDSRDLVLSSSTPTNESCTPPERAVSSRNEEQSSIEKRVPRKSPVKHLVEAAVSRLKPKAKAARLILPEDCPARDPPPAQAAAAAADRLEASDQCGSPLFYSPVSSVESSSIRPMHQVPRCKPVTMKPFDGDETMVTPKVNPDTVKIKKKLHSRGASTDFFIDKVLGQKIKHELERIRSEMKTTSSNTILTDDQIDAISTRLPADKAELMRFFPKSWCDRYGDIVLDVVHKEFKEHVKERRNGRRENDENNRNAHNAAPDAPPPSKFGTFKSLGAKGFDHATMVTPKKVTTSFNAPAEYERELEGKLSAEIQRLPLGRPLRA